MSKMDNQQRSHWQPYTMLSCFFRLLVACAQGAPSWASPALLAEIWRGKPPGEAGGLSASSCWLDTKLSASSCWVDTRLSGSSCWVDPKLLGSSCPAGAGSLGSGIWSG